ncbi:MAG: TonB-dependent receptor [Luminiphilus sp.]|nr:TonB-dependent receptor [Luminiphilus sp.]
MRSFTPRYRRRQALTTLPLTAAVSAAISATAAFLPSVAMAQLEEVVVTARARAESLQDVPATVTAFTEGQIENMGVERAEDFIYMTPGVTFVNTVEVGDSSLSIRGINGARDAETNFAFIVDGVLYTNPSAFNREYPDLAQIEVLKGPQGALYGRSAAAGAVIMSTKRPTQEFEGSVKVGAAEYGTYYGTASVAGGLGEDVAGRVTLSHRQTDGSLNNVYLRDDVVNNYEETSVSARLVWDASDTMTVDTKLRVSEVSAASIAFNAAFELPYFVGALEGVTGFGVDNTAASIDVNDFEWVYSPNVDPENEQETVELSIKIDKQLDNGTLTAWALFSDQEQYFLADGTSGAFGFYDGLSHCQESAAARSLFLGDNTPMQAPTFNLDGTAAGRFLPPYSPTTCDGYQYQERNQRDISFQLQWTSDADQRLRWQAGMYFLNIDRRVGLAQLEDDGRANLPRSFVNELTDAMVLDDFETTVLSGFGSINYDITDRMELSFALRYDIEDREVRNGVPSPADGNVSTNIDYCGAFFDNGCTLNGAPLGGTPWNPAFIDLSSGAVSARVDKRSEEFDAIQPKLSLSYDLSDNTTLFGSWGVGFKTGGFNNLGGTEIISLFLVNPDGLPVAPPEIYEEETSSSFEVGVRSTLLDGNLQLNAAAYHTAVDDMQFFEFYVGPFGLLRTVEGIDEVTIQGFEVGASWQMTDGLRLDAGYSTIDGEIDAMTVRPYVAGNDVPNAAEFTANLALTWDQNIGNLNLMARLEYAYQGDIFYHVVQGSDLDTPKSYDFEGLPYEVPATLFGGLATSYSKTKVDGYGITNLRVGLSGERWRVTAFARNLFDEKFVAEVIMAPEFGGAFVTPGAYRTAGVEVQWNF